MPQIPRLDFKEPLESVHTFCWLAFGDCTGNDLGSRAAVYQLYKSNFNLQAPDYHDPYRYSLDSLSNKHEQLELAKLSGTTFLAKHAYLDSRASPEFRYTSLCTES